VPNSRLAVFGGTWVLIVGRVAALAAKGQSGNKQKANGNGQRYALFAYI
jgi:hypothetical protein